MSMLLSAVQGGSLVAQTQTITVNASSVVRDVPAGLGGVVAGGTFWNSLLPNYRDDLINARVGVVRITGYPSSSAGGSIEELDMRVAQILNTGAVPIFIQCIAAETNTAFKNKLYRTDGTFYPAGDTTPVAQRVATNLAFLVNRYKSAPFNVPVQYWEIGNEPDIPLNYKVSTPAEYIGFFSAAHNQLVTSGIRNHALLAGPVLSWDYGYDTARDTLMRDFLTACASQVDIVTRHIYGSIYHWESPTAYTPYVLLNSTKETLHFDSSILGGSGRGEGQLLAAMNARGVPTSVGTGVTEMNLFNNDHGGGVTSSFNFTITQGLWFLLTHHYALQNPRSLITNNFQFDRWNEGNYGGNLAFYNGSKARSFPYWATYMHGALTGNQVISATSTNSHLVVTATKDDSYVYVQVINRHDTLSYSTNVTINNAPPVTAATRFKLSATDTPDVGVATAHGTSFSETFAPMTATIFRYPRTDAPVPPATPAAPSTPHLVTSFDSVPSGMLTYANGFTPVVAAGRLQLTTASSNKSSAVVFNGQPLAAASNRVQVRFGFKVMHINAEGFVFGAYSADPGAVGASGQGLGYNTQNNRIWGVKIDNNPDQISVISNITNATADGWATKALSPYANLDLFAVIDYDGTAGTVRARLYQSVDDSGTLLADLTNRVGNPSSLPAGTVFGFTGATGSFSQTTYIENLSILLDDFVLGQEVILDNTAPSGVTITGNWAVPNVPSTYYGTNYLHDGNSGKGVKSVRFTPTLTGAGLRDVYLRWPQFGNWSTNVPVAVTHAGGTANVSINQTTGASQWV
ncbi:MAG: hypothetical protein ABW223_12190, partial [Rariglobus sp.]